MKDHKKQSFSNPVSSKRDQQNEWASEISKKFQTHIERQREIGYTNRMFVSPNEITISSTKDKKGKQ